jgi:sugar/nucleoside kinase (ribokinase family)
MGRRGALAQHRDQVLRAAAYQLDCVDESGAGDAFDAGFVTGLLEHWPLEITLRFASAVGASCTRRLGCTTGVFSLEEAEAFVAQNPLGVTHTRQQG